MEMDRIDRKDWNKERVGEQPRGLEFVRRFVGCVDESGGGSDDGGDEMGRERAVMRMRRRRRVSVLEKLFGEILGV